MERSPWPNFLKQFSKEHLPEERRQVAQEIKNQRAEQREYDRLVQEISALETSGLNKFLNYFNYKKLKTELSNRDAARGNDSDAVPDEFSECENTLNQFRQRVAEQWSGQEYSKDEAVALFSEEHLKSLNIDEYTLLLQRFPDEMVTHVTRQGLRAQNAGAFFHNAGTGQFHDGFKGMLQDGKLHSALSRALVQEDKLIAVANYFSRIVENYREYPDYKDRPAREIALEILEDLNSKIVGGYNDKVAYHFGNNAVLDEFYGGESGNEIFLVYPTIYMASQYRMRYQRGSMSFPESDFNNDTWVWDNENNGLDTDAGIFFIPKNAKVDPKTGSAYTSNSEGQPIVDNTRIQNLKEAIENPDIMPLLERLKLVYEMDDSDFKNQFGIEKDWYNTGNCIAQLVRESGINNEDLIAIVSDSAQELDNLIYNLKNQVDYVKLDDLVSSLLSKIDGLYKRADNTIDSMQYWEEYFKNNPNIKKPSKIVYYDAKSKSPTKALNDWKYKNNIRSSREKRNEMFYMFKDNHNPAHDPLASRGKEEFMLLAMKAIDLLEK